MAVLVSYSIRSKQSYIYRTNKIKEIAGASELIRSAFDYFKSSKRIVGTDETFDIAKVIEAFEGTGDTQPDGYIVYEGGGNFYILFKDRDTCIYHNKLFSKGLFDSTHALTPLIAIVDVDLHEDNYKGDFGKLMAKSEALKKTDEPLEITNALPFSLMDRKTNLPIIGTNEFNEQITAQGKAKLDKYKEISGSFSECEKLLDRMVSQKGDESLLAVVYADGNNMGKKVEKALYGKVRYNESVATLRSLSQKIDEHFISEGIKAITEKMNELTAQDKENKHIYSWRRIIGGGDEITFICNARCAFLLAKTYLDSVNKNGYSSCAGIAVFHSHYPFSEAYKAAEQACESAKDRAKDVPDSFKEKAVEASFIDFEFIQTAMLKSKLKKERESRIDKIDRPYCVSVCVDSKDATEEFCKLKGYHTTEQLDRLADTMSIARSSIKELGKAAFYSTGEHKITFKRIMSQHKDLEKRVLEIIPDDSLYRVLYDFSEFYDIWFVR